MTTTGYHLDRDATQASRDAVNAWLAANAVNAADVPVHLPIGIGEHELTVWVYYRDSDGRFVEEASGVRAPSQVTVELLTPPTAEVMAALRPIADGGAVETGPPSGERPLLDEVTAALVAHRVDREGPDFDHADPSLLGYARAVTSAVLWRERAAYERGVAEGTVAVEQSRLHAQMVAKAGADAYQRGVADGRRQATEGWEREWAVRLRDGLLEPDDERYVRAHARAEGPNGTIASRLVGPWEPTEHAEPEPCDRTDLPEFADMMCGGCGVRAGDHPVWRRRNGRRRAAEPAPAEGEATPAPLARTCARPGCGCRLEHVL